MKNLAIIFLALFAFTADAQTALKQKHRGLDQNQSLCVKATGGDKCLTVEGTTGYVGIGTETPSGVNLSILNATGSQTSLQLDNSGTGGRRYRMETTTDAHGVGGGKFLVRDMTANAYRMSIDSTGRVGIGTHTPTANLDVVGTANISGNTDLGGRVKLNTQTRPAGTYNNDNTNVSTTPVIFLDTSGGNMTIRSLGNGGGAGPVSGQMLHLVKTVTANSVTINNNFGSAAGNIFTRDGLDLVLVTRGGATLVGDGTNWHVIADSDN